MSLRRLHEGKQDANHMALVCTRLCPRLRPKGDIERPTIARRGGGKGREGEDVGVKGKLLSRLLLCERVSLGCRKARVVFLDRL